MTKIIKKEKRNDSATYAMEKLRRKKLRDCVEELKMKKRKAKQIKLKKISTKITKKWKTRLLDFGIDFLDRNFLKMKHVQTTKDCMKIKKWSMKLFRMWAYRRPAYLCPTWCRTPHLKLACLSVLTKVWTRPAVPSWWSLLSRGTSEHKYFIISLTDITQTLCFQIFTFIRPVNLRHR